MIGKKNTKSLSSGLNPCCNGIYLMIETQQVTQQVTQDVLILVVMEYT